MTMPDIDVQKLRALLAAATPAPWVIHTGCSWRRISHEGDGDVVCPELARHDRHPDLRAKEEDLDLIAALRNAAEALLAATEERDALRAKLNQWELDAAEARGSDEAWHHQLVALRAENERLCVEGAEPTDEEWQRLRAMNATLRESLAGLRDAAEPAADRVWPLDASASYDALADAFYAETGNWPPGRDRPMAMGGHDEEAARIAWNVWKQERVTKIAARLREAVAAAGKALGDQGEGANP